MTYNYNTHAVTLLNLKYILKKKKKVVFYLQLFSTMKMSQERKNTNYCNLINHSST